MKAAILTVSDLGASGERTDTSGPAVREMLETSGFEVPIHEVIPDERDKIAARLRSWVDARAVQLIVTTGGTGLAPRDVTPEATKEVVEYEVPGIAEAMRAEGLRHTQMAMIGRGIAGVRNGVLIVNLPGSEKGARESLAVVLPVLHHAIELLAGKQSDHTGTSA